MCRAIEIRDRSISLMIMVIIKINASTPLITCTVVYLKHHHQPKDPLKKSCGGLLVWQYQLSSFQEEGMKIEKKMPKNQHTQRNFLNFGYCTNGSCQKVPNFDFRSQFSMSKIIRIFLIFFYYYRKIID